MINTGNSTIIVTLVVTKVDIQIDQLVFRPGMNGNMAFAETDHRSESAWFKFMVNFSELLQIVCDDQFVDFLTKGLMVLQQFIGGSFQRGQYMRTGAIAHFVKVLELAKY